MANFDENRVTICCNWFNNVLSKLNSTALGWSMLYSKRCVMVGWLTGEICIPPLLSPPQPMLECNANTLYDALFLQDRQAAIRALTNEVLLTAEERGRLRGRDGAASNIKMCTYEFNEAEVTAPRREMNSYIGCFNHTENLVDVSVTALVGKEPLLQMTATHSILKMGSFFLRVAVVVKAWLLREKNLRIVYGDPPLEATRLQEEILDYISSTYGQFSKATQDDAVSDTAKTYRRGKYLTINSWNVCNRVERPLLAEDSLPLRASNKPTPSRRHCIIHGIVIRRRSATAAPGFTRN